MKKPETDPIVAEVRAIRDAHASRFNYDLRLICEDIRKMQEASGREYVQYPPRPAVSTDAAGPDR